MAYKDPLVGRSFRLLLSHSSQSSPVVGCVRAVSITSRSPSLKSGSMAWPRTRTILKSLGFASASWRSIESGRYHRALSRVKTAGTSEHPSACHAGTGHATMNSDSHFLGGVDLWSKAAVAFERPMPMPSVGRERRELL